MSCLIYCWFWFLSQVWEECGVYGCILYIASVYNDLSFYYFPLLSIKREAAYLNLLKLAYIAKENNILMLSQSMKYSNWFADFL